MKKIFAAICFLSLVGFGARVYADDTPASIPPVVDEVPLATEETPAPQEEAPPVVSAPVPRESVIVRVGDQVLFSGEQPAGITAGDLADGVLNEAEKPAHLRQRLTLGY